VLRRNEFYHIGGKSGGSDQDKSEEERDFHLMQSGVIALDHEKIGCLKTGCVQRQGTNVCFRANR
jgi:hypothetical protein